jgi:hypothetical protein
MKAADLRERFGPKPSWAGVLVLFAPLPSCTALGADELLCLRRDAEQATHAVLRPADAQQSR